MTELKFHDVALQMLFTAERVGAAHTALEDAKEVFGGVGCLTIGANIFTATAQPCCTILCDANAVPTCV